MQSRGPKWSARSDLAVSPTIISRSGISSPQDPNSETQGLLPLVQAVVAAIAASEKVAMAVLIFISPPLRGS